MKNKTDKRSIKVKNFGIIEGKMATLDPEIEALLTPFREAVKICGDRVRELKANGAASADVALAVQDLKAKKKELEEDDSSTDITQTPKFKLLELVREIDDEEGIAPDELLLKAEAADIPRPRLQMNKMIRRGILYIHEGKIHVT